MKKIFLTFADSRMSRTLARIKAQAEKMGVYDRVICATEFDLERDFRSQFREHLKPSVRGYGYWCWKPQIIKQALCRVSDGDLLQYTDAGCHLNPKGRSRLVDYFSIVSSCEKGVLAFQAKEPEGELFNHEISWPDLVEKKWIKGDLLDYFNVRNRLDIIDTQTVGAGIVFVRNCAESRALVESWLQVIKDDFHYIDDTPSFSPNLDGFVEHRHDQSIFSVLCKINSIKTLSAYEYWYPKKNLKGPDWKVLENYPIHAKRDKNFGIYKKIVMVVHRIVQKIYRYTRELDML